MKVNKPMFVKSVVGTKQIGLKIKTDEIWSIAMGRT